MGSIIKTYKEHTIVGTGYSSWTLTFIGNDQKPVNGPYFYLESPMTIKAKYTGGNRVFAETSIDVDIVNERCWFHIAETSWASKVEKTIAFEGFVYGHDDPIQTSDIFNETNKDTRIANLDCITELPDARFYLSTRDKDGDSWSAYTKSKTSVNLGGLIGITLDAPPTFTAEETTAAPYYKTLTPYEVSISDVEAKYGGDITEVKLTLGNQTATGSGDGTLSITPNTAGPFIPVISVTDSRGQITEHTLPQITVNDYNAPSILNYRIARCDTNGKLQDDGENAILAVDYSYFNAVTDLKKPKTKNGISTISSNTTWYTTYDASTGVSNPITFPYSAPTTGTIYGVIRTTLSKDDSFQISLELEDNVGGKSGEITQTLSPTFYTIDFLAGGKGVAFGAPSREEIFKVAMPTDFLDMTSVEIDTFIQALGLHGRTICPYDVGDIYITRNSTDPATKWEGTTWRQIKDTFLLAAGDDYTAGDTGGEAEVTLTVDTMPSHNHTQNQHRHSEAGNYSDGSGSSSAYMYTSNRKATTHYTSYATPTINSTGGGQPHENMPPYLVVYAWERLS